MGNLGSPRLNKPTIFYDSHENVTRYRWPLLKSSVAMIARWVGPSDVVNTEPVCATTASTKVRRLRVLKISPTHCSASTIARDKACIWMVIGGQVEV